jgi:hypothetical protein
MNIQEKIRELDELRAELVQRAQQEDGIEALEEAQPRIKPGSKEHEALLSTGYGMDKRQAETIIKERAERPELWPYEMLEKARAFLAALRAKPKPVSTRRPWRTRHRSRVTTAR